jgi:hypothetical protein
LCTTLVLEGGADIRFIQRLLGHEKLETTQIYAQFSIRPMLKEVHTRTHPARNSVPGPADAGASGLRDGNALASVDNAELAAELVEDEAELADVEPQGLPVHHEHLGNDR